MNKLEFIQNEFPRLVAKLDPNAKGVWGVMNGQQMVEHMADSISQATGNNTMKLHTPADQVEKYKSFMMSDKEFRPNTKNALLPDVPAPPVKGSMADAVAEYSKQVADFVAYFEKNKGATITNSIFGDLNYEEWLHLFQKHSTHHLKQFQLL